MNVEISPNRLAGRISVPASKSLAHRYLIASALANAPTAIHGLEPSEDIDATMRCLVSLGTRIEGDTVHPMQLNRSALMRCGESGATLRMLLPVTAALGLDAMFIGEGSLIGRPLKPLVDTLVQNGAVINRTTLPVTVSGKLHGGQYGLPGNVSSQFISGLLLALPMTDTGGTITLSTHLESEGYVQMTLDVLEEYEITAMTRENGYNVPGSQPYRTPGTVNIPGDWSSAAAMLTAGAVCGKVTVRGLQIDARQPDQAIIGLLERFGANVRLDEEGVTASRAPMKGITADVSGYPDLFPALAVLGAVAEGKTVIQNAIRVKEKESDRISTSAAMLRAFGVNVEEKPDGLVIHGGKALHAGTVDASGDHRIAMAAAVLASASGGESVIEGAECVSKSYPRFFDDFKALGGLCRGIDVR